MITHINDTYMPCSEVEVSMAELNSLRIVVREHGDKLDKQKMIFGSLRAEVNGLLGKGKGKGGQKGNGKDGE